VDTFLRDQRTERALAASDVARRLAVHPNSVLRWERRDQLPGPQHIHALAGTLGIDVARVAAFFDGARADAAPVTGVRGHGLRPLRWSAGVPVRRIAAALGVPAATVYNWEAGRVRIPEDHLSALASVLGTTVPVMTACLRAAPTPASTPPASTPPSPLRRLRRRAGLSQEALARRIGTTRHRVGAWERGERPPLWAVRRMAREYGVPVARLASLAGVPAPPLLDPGRWTAGDLPAVLATMRAWNGLTQAEVAARCGFHPTSVRAWENGRTVPSRRSREQLERVLGLPAGALLRAYPASG
jgi:transcriptional regulator with XRE-family HTH domain